MNKQINYVEPKYANKEQEYSVIETKYNPTTDKTVSKENFCKKTTNHYDHLPYSSAEEIERLKKLEKFTKYDENKLRYELIPHEAVKALAQIITHGAEKYKQDNWKECEDLSRYIGACMRHIEAYRSGEKIDKDSGYSHLAHALTNIAFLIWFEDNKGSY